VGGAEGGEGGGVAGELVGGRGSGGGVEDPGDLGVRRGGVLGGEEAGEEALGGVVVERVGREG
jgi:hypothetical protein